MSATTEALEVLCAKDEAEVSPLRGQIGSDYNGSVETLRRQ